MIPIREECTSCTARVKFCTSNDGATQCLSGAYNYRYRLPGMPTEGVQHLGDFLHCLGEKNNILSSDIFEGLLKGRGAKMSLE